MKNNLSTLLKDNNYFAALMNGPCKITGFSDEKTDVPVNPDWIDDDTSEALTATYQTFLPESLPYSSVLKVVRDPETDRNGTVVNEDRHRTRYIILTVLPECSFPYDWNYAILHTMSIVSLSGWELSRAALEASKQWMKVMMEKEPKQMILNNARIQWVSLYVGKKEWGGSTKFSDHKGISLADEGDDADVDMHFMNARESEDPLMKRLVEAFDADNPEPTATDTTESTAESTAEADNAAD